MIVCVTLLSKLAHIHCVSTEGARARLMAMGVDVSAIHVTGAPASTR